MLPKRKRGEPWWRTKQQENSFYFTYMAIRDVNDSQSIGTSASKSKSDVGGAVVVGSIVQSKNLKRTSTRTNVLGVSSTPLADIQRMADRDQSRRRLSDHTENGAVDGGAFPCSLSSWHADMILGPFENRDEATTVCEAWKYRARGIMSRRARGVDLACTHQIVCWDAQCTSFDRVAS